MVQPATKRLVTEKKLNDTVPTILSDANLTAAAARRASGKYIYGVDWPLASDHGVGITDAVNAITSAGGGELLLPPGKYICQTPIVPTAAKGVKLVGAVPGLQYGSSTDFGSMLVAENGSNLPAVIKGYWENCEFSSFRIDAMNEGAGIAGDFSKMIMERLEISNYTGYGINANTGEYTGSTLQYLLRINECGINAENGFGVGIWVSWRITDSWIQGCNIGSTGPNIYVEGGTIRILDNHLNGVTEGGPENNVKIVSSSGAYLINQNICEHSRHEAILIERPSWETGHARLASTISGNIIRDSGWDNPGAYSAIKIKGNTAGAPSARFGDISVGSNTMYDQHDSILHALHLEGVVGASVMNNNWTDCHTVAEAVKSVSSTKVEVLGNVGDNGVLTT